ncbi:MAG: DUF6529 family protein [Solirubrobacterales bacterium]
MAPPPDTVPEEASAPPDVSPIEAIVRFGLLAGRVAVHSLAGCFFYGAVAAKLTIVRSRRLPGWTLPLAGGTLVVLVAVLWYTSALWYFNDFRLPAL